MEIKTKIYCTDTTIFVTIQKVASTLLSSLFDDSLKTGMVFDYSIDIINKRIIPAETNIGTIQYDTIRDFGDIFSNKCNKNIVVLYRNPKNRLTSAIIEDFNSIIMNDTYSDFTLNLLFKTFNASQSTYHFFKNNLSALYLSKIDKSDIELNDFLETSFTYYMQYLSDLGFNNQHAVDYLSEFYNMVNSGIFDESKLILCDIDTKTLTPLLDTLSIIPDYENHIHSNMEFKPIIDRILTNGDNQYIISKYNEKLNSENHFYELLKNHSNNFKIQI